MGEAIEAPGGDADEPQVAEADGAAGVVGREALAEGFGDRRDRAFECGSSTFLTRDLSCSQGKREKGHDKSGDGCGLEGQSPVIIEVPTALPS